jgi:hypothetical protein
MSRSILLLALSLFGTGALFADTVFSTFGPGQSFLTGGVWMVGGQPPEEIAASFVPAQDFTLETIDFAAVFLSGTDSQVDVSLAAGASAPGAPIESFTVSGLSTIPAVLTVNSASHPQLDAGVTYWIVLSAPDPAATLAGWNQNDQGFVGVSARLDGGAWFDLGTEVLTPAFDVLGIPAIPTVPEPSTGPLVTLVIACQLAVFMGRRRKSGRS